jgi:phosphoenolpyruvate carboxykinase (GTP)
MAMKPFCGYHFADYWAHWLSFAEKANQLPDIFTVNWFRKDGDNKFMWPGFGENMRVLEWIINRVTGKVAAKTTAIGDMPYNQDFNLQGIDFNDSDLDALLEVDSEAWKDEVTDVREYLHGFGDKVPASLFEELEKTKNNINSKN